jgi:hypothetical protein
VGQGVDARSARLELDVALKSDPVGVLAVVLLAVEDGLGDDGRADDVIPLLRLGDKDLVGDRVDARALELGLDPVGEERVAGGVANVDDALLRVARRLDDGDVAHGKDLVDERPRGRLEVLEPLDVDLVDDEQRRLVGKEGLDRVEELALKRKGKGRGSERVGEKLGRQVRKGDGPEPQPCSRTARSGP